LVVDPTPETGREAGAGQVGRCPGRWGACPPRAGVSRGAPSGVRSV